MMKKIILFCILIAICSSLVAQNVGINTTTPAASAALDIVATIKGILIPRMTQAQREAIAKKGL